MINGKDEIEVLSTLDLKRWRNVSIKLFKRGRTLDFDFTSDYISRSKMDNVRSILPLAESVDDIKAVFYGLGSSVPNEMEYKKPANPPIPQFIPDNNNEYINTQEVVQKDVPEDETDRLIFEDDVFKSVLEYFSIQKELIIANIRDYEYKFIEKEKELDNFAHEVVDVLSQIDEEKSFHEIKTEILLFDEVKSEDWLSQITSREFWDEQIGAMFSVMNVKLLMASIRSMFNAIAGINLFPKTKITDVDLTKVNDLVKEWADTYSYDLVDGINDTTKKLLQEKISNWFGSGMPLAVLIKELSGIYSEGRASFIAQTEVTRAFAQGQLVAWNEMKVPYMRWRTRQDEKVCAICGALDKKIIELSEKSNFSLDDNADGYLPPAHVSCRCYLEGVVEKDIIEEKAYYGHAGRPGLVGGSSPRSGTDGGFVQSPVRDGGDSSDHNSINPNPPGLNYPDNQELQDWFYDYPDRDVTELQRGTIGMYTAQGYKHINGYLRGTTQQPDYYDNWNFIQEIDDALEGKVLGEDLTLYRGMTTDKIDELFVVGDTYTDKGYISTTTNTKMARLFFGGEHSQNVILVIKAKKDTKGMPVRKISKLKIEDEVLLDRDTKFIVKSKIFKPRSAENPPHTEIILEPFGADVQQ